MSNSTTLMTFLVRTPLNTISVDLYGSWDNFSTPYAMSRDVRLGREHWSGCHTFENIICDGNTDDHALFRKGGLKMGGTYWYYYKLDDEIEFHNSAEPSTTRCPMLPGQLVNELQVPFALSGSRKRDDSVSSTSSERRTLDPEAKFINPSPVPARPALVRLNTSPTILPSPKNDGSKFAPASAAPFMQAHLEEEFGIASSRIFHLPRKPSLDALLKVGAAHNSAGLRSSFVSSDKAWSASQSDKYRDIINWIPDKQVEKQHEGNIRTDFECEPKNQPTKSVRGELLLRSNAEEAVPLASFKEHRRQRSRSRSRCASNRNSIACNQATRLDLNSRRNVEPSLLSALMEVCTPGLTPGYGPTTGRRITLDALEGRNEQRYGPQEHLPMVPDMPSSATLQTLADISLPSHDAGVEVDLSRFSATTIDSACHLDILNSIDLDDEQHTFFHDSLRDGPWSPASESSTIEQSVCDSDVTEGFSSPSLRPISTNAAVLAEIQNEDNSQNNRILSAAFTCTTIRSSGSTTPTTLYGDNDSAETSRFSYATSIRSSAASFDNYQHYSLPSIENASEVTLKRYNVEDHSSADNKSQLSQHDSDLSHSENMQQLLSELSYLSNMIQN